jgi:ABC-type Fe3+ transport system permease subunit
MLGLAGGLVVVVAIAVLLGQNVADSITTGLGGGFAVALVYTARRYTRAHRTGRPR